MTWLNWRSDEDPIKIETCSQSHIINKFDVFDVHLICYLLENLTGSEVVKKFPAFYGTRRFITPFKSARHLSLSWANSIQSMPSPHSTSWRSTLIYSSLLRLCLPSGLFSSGFPTKTLYTPLLSHTCTCPAHIILLSSCIKVIPFYILAAQHMYTLIWCFFDRAS